MESIRILVADDHVLIRAGVRSLLQSIADFQVVGEASDGMEAMELVSALRPDVLLTDIAMPNLNGLKVAEQVAEKYPDVRVIIVSMHTNEEFVAQAVKAGAAGYLLKDADGSELEFAIRAVTRGESYLTPAISKQVMASYMSLVNSSHSQLADPLTHRQREILKLIAEGVSTKGIAKVLEISVKTVETHRSQIMQRLEIHDIPGLVRYAMRTGLVPAVEIDRPHAEAC